MAIWVDGHWYYDGSLRSFSHIPSGNYEEGVDPETDIVVPTRFIGSLIDVALEQGFYTQRPVGREEDLRIVHRLLDILEKP